VKVISLSHSDNIGGAARAAYRLHKALSDSSVDSKMLVRESSLGDETVYRFSGDIGTRIIKRIGGALSRLLMMSFRTANPILHSPAIIPTHTNAFLNASDADIIHLHWINHDTVSIADIGRLKKPVVWTLHDMWAFCGAEHITTDCRWRDGYKSDNRPEYESGFDLNSWTWHRKLKHWSHPIHIVTPSHWLAEFAQKSILMHEWPIYVIPNPIDTLSWCPANKDEARQFLRLPLNVPLVLFGVWGSIEEKHKGFDLLLDALQKLRDQLPTLELVVFGHMDQKNKVVDIGFPIHFMGQLNDDQKLRSLYNAVDVTIVPSRQEAFGQVASESHSCGTPVVAFNATGLIDIVDHLQTGYLAKAFDSEDLANGVKWVLAESKRHSLLSQAARARAVKLWSYKTVATQYLSVYQKAIETY
jgi:glycosyltransferase involved in cell wall biosynthesis